MRRFSRQYPKGIHWYLLYMPKVFLYSLWLLLLLLFLAYPLWKSGSQYYQAKKLELMLFEQIELEAKQKQLLQHLQKKVSERQDTQKNTQKLAELHQQLSDLSQESAISFDMQVSNKSLLRVELDLYTSFHEFIEYFDLLFQDILANWSIDSLRIERGNHSEHPGLLHIAIHLFSEELRE
ncbi:hypothetical protein ACFFHT_03360 [Gallibacterium melopsittaci]|uniref:Competence protein C n=1 Tax=Gallibacterium melopsittaci TaxID=516063 RepID=A0ABV6HVG3_9PAST